MSDIILEKLMPYRPGKDLISQAELLKGAEFMIGTSSAVGLVRELYMDALERRIARGAIIEPGSLGFVESIGVIPERKEASTETRVTIPGSRNHSSGNRQPQYPSTEVVG